MIFNKKSSSLKMRRPLFTSKVSALLLIVLSAAIHIGWMSYTHYTEEDAHITFRYAEQISRGNGFVYNIGEPVYGTTTPLLTILLSLWLTFISSNVILGANILNLLTAVSIPIFTWKTLLFLKRSSSEIFFVLTSIVLSSKLIYMNTNGMEISLSIGLIAGSWYTWVTGKTKLTGLLCGLLLWTRIDNVFLPILLILVTLISSKKNALTLGLITAITYLPWVIFAAFYFGSPIPHTITAKWAAYSQFNQTSYVPHLAIILKYLSPFRIQTEWQWLGTLIVLGAACWGIWKKKLFQESSFYILILFAIVEISRLTFTRATFFSRYFIPILWVILILSGMGLGVLWDQLKMRSASKIAFLFFLIFLAVTQVGSGISLARTAWEWQTFRHEASLKTMGLWLKNNTPPQSTILLEPLGYVGYYSERTMIDAVGLVTPSVTKLKIQQVDANEYVSIFKPDYIILHCDETTPIQFITEKNYRRAETFNPLDYTAGSLYSSDLPRSSCYQIWKNINN